MTGDVRHAACACGGLSISVRGDPQRVGMCHCQQCQRRTGSAFGLAAIFARDQLAEAHGPRSAYSRQGESGGTLTFSFCPTCGSTVFWEHSNLPEVILVALGAFADPGFPGPTGAFWAESRHPWVETLHELPAQPRAAG